jgi:hypothetical protein
LEPFDCLPCGGKGVYVQSINQRRPSWKRRNEGFSMPKWYIWNMKCSLSSTSCTHRASGQFIFRCGPRMWPEVCLLDGTPVHHPIGAYFIPTASLFHPHCVVPISGYRVRGSHPSKY